MENFNINRGFHSNYPSAFEAEQSSATYVAQPAYRPTDKVEPAIISDHSIAMLNMIENSSDADHRMAATYAKHLLNSHKLRLCAHQPGTLYAKYGDTFTTSKKQKGTLIIATENNDQSKLEISQIAIKWKKSSDGSIKVNLPPNPASISRTSASDARGNTQQFPSNGHESPGVIYAPRASLTQTMLSQQILSVSRYAGVPSSSHSTHDYADYSTLNPSRQMEYPHNLGAPSPPVNITQVQSAISKDSQRAVKAITNNLASWDKKTAKTNIEAKLRNTPTDQHQLILQELRNKISGKSVANTKVYIEEWVMNSNLRTATEGRDIRTAGEKQLQDQIVNFMNYPAFRKQCDEVFALLPTSHRLRSQTTSITEGKYYQSPLYARVFSGHDTPTALIEKLKNHISQYDLSSRHQAIVDWNPAT